MPSGKIVLNIVKNFLESISKTNCHISSDLQQRIKLLQQPLLWCYKDTWFSWRLQLAVAIPGLNSPYRGSASTLSSLCSHPSTQLPRFSVNAFHSAAHLLPASQREATAWGCFSSRLHHTCGTVRLLPFVWGGLSSEPRAVRYPHWFSPPRCQSTRYEVTPVQSALEDGLWAAWHFSTGHQLR